MNSCPRCARSHYTQHCIEYLRRDDRGARAICVELIEHPLAIESCAPEHADCSERRHDAGAAGEQRCIGAHVFEQRRKRQHTEMPIVGAQRDCCGERFRNATERMAVETDTLGRTGGSRRVGDLGRRCRQGRGGVESQPEL